MTAYLGPGNYHIEHILEWQTVTKFFDWMDRKMEGVTFLDPDQSRISGNKEPKSLDFCGYWKQHWKGGYMPILDINGKELEPMGAYGARVSWSGKSARGVCLASSIDQHPSKKQRKEVYLF